jgi:hypothetical protein
MRRRAAVLLVVLGSAAAGELEDARAQLASPRASDRLAAIRRLAKIDSGGAIDALAHAVKRSGDAIDQLGKRLDKNDREWERAFDKAFQLEARGKYGTDAYRKAAFRQGTLEKEWDALNLQARTHLDVLHAAADALRQFRSEDGVAAIETGARAHPRPLVRLLYIGALGDTRRASSLQTLTDLVTGDRDPRVRSQAVRGLVGWAPKGWEIAAAAAEDPCWGVRRGAIEALAHAPAFVSIPRLIEAAGRESGELRLTAFAYLRELTQARVGDSHGAWTQWWSTHKDAVSKGEFEPPDAPPEKPGRRTYARFFHVPIESTHVVFAIDFSGSMKAPLRLANARANRVRERLGLRPTRLGYAKAELIAAIGELPDGALFNVAVFSDRARFLFRRPVAAGARTRGGVERLIVGTSTGTMTNIWDALNITFADYLDASGGATRFADIPDTLLFLTDGNATRGRFRTASSLRKLVDLWNQPLDVVIHCIGIGADHDRELLEGLAEKTGGYYVDVRRGVEDLPPRRRPLKRK